MFSWFGYDCFDCLLISCYLLHAAYGFMLILDVVLGWLVVRFCGGSALGCFDCLVMFVLGWVVY